MEYLEFILQLIERFRILTFIFAGIFIVNSIALMIILTRDRSLEEAYGVSTSDFTVYRPKKYACEYIKAQMFTLPLVFIFVLLMSNWNPGYDRLLFFYTVFPVATLITIAHAVYEATWKLHIYDDSIHLTTLLGPRIFSFHEIAQTKMRPDKLVLYRDGSKLFSVRIDSIGFYEFLNHLQKKNLGLELPVICDTPKGRDTISIRKEIAKAWQEQWNKRFTLWWLQIVFIAAAIIPLVVLLEFGDAWILAGTYTASEVLQGYLLWLQLTLILCAGALVIILFSNMIVISSLRRTFDFTKRHVITAAIGIVVVGGLSVYGFWDTVPIVRDVEYDIATLESGELAVTDYYLHLSWQNYYRTASLRDLGDYRPLYVVSRPPLGRAYFPREFAPAILKEMAAGEEFRVAGQPAGFRLFEIWYTPRLQIVVMVEVTG